MAIYSLVWLLLNVIFVGIAAPLSPCIILTCNYTAIYLFTTEHLFFCSWFVVCVFFSCQFLPLQLMLL